MFDPIAVDPFVWVVISAVDGLAYDLVIGVISNAIYAKLSSSGKNMKSQLEINEVM